MTFPFFQGFLWAGKKEPNLSWSPFSSPDSLIGPHDTGKFSVHREHQTMQVQDVGCEDRARFLIVPLPHQQPGHLCSDVFSSHEHCFSLSQRLFYGSEKSMSAYWEILSLEKGTDFPVPLFLII